MMRTRIIPALLIVGTLGVAHAEPRPAAVIATKTSVRVPPKPAKPKDAPCPGLPFARLPGPPAFPAGEEMSFDFHAGGLFVGRVDMKVGAPKISEGREVIPLIGRARTTMFTGSIQKFEGRYMSLIDAKTLEPVRLRTQSVYGEEPRAELVSFSPDRRTMDIKFQAGTNKGTRDYGRRESGLFDVLGLLYYARVVDLTAGAKVCQEVVADRRLWRMEAEVLGIEPVATPAGDKPAIHARMRFERIAHKDFDNSKRPWIELDLFLSNDAYRAPLTFTVRNDKVTAKADLVTWSQKPQAGAQDDWDF